MTEPKPIRLSAPDTAKLLRKVLKREFPGVKFSLRGSRGTGYGYYSLSWTGGPSEKDVDAVVGPFEGSYFDGMQDMEVRVKTFIGYGPNGEPLESGFRGVHTHRDTTEQEKAAALETLEREGYSGPEWAMSGAAEMVARGTGILRAVEYYPLKRD